MRLHDAVAIVTGGGQGIGAGIAHEFVRQGARVAIAQRSPEALKRTQSELEAAGGQVLTRQVDVADPAQVGALVADTVDHFGGLDILVNNAGIGINRLVEETDEADYDRLMDTNLKGLWMGCHHAVPHLKARGGGSIINISSVHGIQGGDVNSVYAATKGGIIGTTRALAAELAPFAIRVNTISPGAILVRDTLKLCLDRIDPAHHAAFLERFGDSYDPVHRCFQPLERIGLPQDIAWCAVWLASEESRFVTGQNIAVDGGLTTYLSSLSGERARHRRQAALEDELEAWIIAHAPGTG